MWRQTQWNALSGMFLPVCFRRGSSSVNAAKACACAHVCACVPARLPVHLCTMHRTSPPPSLPPPASLFCFFHSFPSLSCFLSVSLSFFLAGPPLRESSSDISRACLAPHSSAASEECLAHNKRLSSGSFSLVLALLLSFSESFDRFNAF